MSDLVRVPKWATNIDNLRSAAARLTIINAKWKGHECLTLNTCAKEDRDRVLAVLRRFDLPWMLGVPKGGSHVGAVFFLPWMDRVRFAYIFKKGARPNLGYRGSGTRPEYLDACEQVPPEQCVKVFLHVGRDYTAKEEEYQLQGGVRRLATEPDHEIWLNGTVGDGFLALTREQRIALGRVSGRRNVELGHLARLHADPQHREWCRIGGKNGGKTGPAAAANMRRLQADLRQTNDPRFWDSLPLPIAVLPEGWGRQINKSRYGFSIPEDAIITPVAKPPFHWNTRSSGKMARVLMTIYCRSPPTFAEHCVDLRAEFPAPDSYGVPSSAQIGVTRDCRKGLFSLVHEGRVILGPGGPESDCHDPRLSWAPGRGWRRGKVVSRGPYGWAR